MIITQIEPKTKSSFEVYIDDRFAFMLNKGELSHYGLKTGCEVDDELLDLVIHETVLKHAKIKAVQLLAKMGRTEEQLQQKLRAERYSDDVIEKVMQYVKNNGYVNDYEYAYSFVLNRKSEKSRKELVYLLIQKGISEEITDNVLDEIYTKQDEYDTVCRILQKRHRHSTDDLQNERTKDINYLIRKGFSYSVVKTAIRDLDIYDETDFAT